MEAVQRDHWYFMVLLFLPFLKVTVQQKDIITVGLEEGMILNCLCPWNGNLSMVSWTKHPGKDPIAVFHPEYGIAFSHHYRERIEFLRTTPMDGSISMRNVTHQDTGLYHCSVQTFPQGPWTRNVQVEDLDTPPDNGDSPEPPTLAEIPTDIDLVAQQNDNLTIHCNHIHNGTIYQVILEKMPHNQPWSIIGVCKKVEGGLVGEDYSDRGRVSCEDSLDISLHLTGVVPEDGGLYKCTFSTDSGEQTTTVLLTVPPPEPGGFSLSTYMMYIYIGAGAAGLFLIIIILIVALRHRKRNRREEYKVKLHPSQSQHNVYENVLAYPKRGKKHKEIKPCPVYVNLQTVQKQKNKRKL